jgi:hypothetical protein
MERFLDPLQMLGLSDEGEPPPRISIAMTGCMSRE